MAGHDSNIFFIAHWLSLAIVLMQLKIRFTAMFLNARIGWFVQGKGQSKKGNDAKSLTTSNDTTIPYQNQG